jgi:hypothetical protein
MSHLGTVIKPPPDGNIVAPDEPRVEVQHRIPSDPVKAEKQLAKINRLTDKLLRIASRPDEDHEDDE